MDSAVLAYHLKATGYDVHALSFNYGQRHSRELQFAEEIAADLPASHDIIWLGVQGDGPESIFPLSDILKGSSLTDTDVEVPEGHYAEENMKATVVPNRNAIMLSIAYGVAVAEGADIVTFAAHAGDHAIYPDCRPIFVELLNETLQVGNEWATPVPRLYGPFLTLSKADIVRTGSELDVPFELTWSCYKGGDIHCGKCGTCVERAEAFALANVEDPTKYEDPDFWKEAVRVQSSH